MQLITQAELARHLDLTRSRVNQLLKQGIFSIHDTEHGLLDRDYCEHRYQEYMKDNIGHVSKNREIKERKLYKQAKSKVEQDLRTRLNDAVDKALPLALEIYKTDYEYTQEQLEDKADGMLMFYSELIGIVTGDRLSSYNQPGNPEIINEYNKLASSKKPGQRVTLLECIENVQANHPG